MIAAEPRSAVPKPSVRWFHLTPDRVVLALLAVEGLLWLSERLGWLAWHKGYAVLTAVASVGVVLVGEQKRDSSEIRGLGCLTHYYLANIGPIPFFCLAFFPSCPSATL